MVQPVPRWWDEPEVLARWVRDLLQAELTLLRPGGWPLPHTGWQPGLDLVRDLGVDSLELLALSTALADAVRLRDADMAEALYAGTTVGQWTDLARQALAGAGEGAGLGFRSSGSTGAPKSCVHPLAELAQEMQAMAAVLGPVRRIVCTVRSHHIYGFLFSALLPRLLGGAPVLDLHGRPPALVAARLAPGDLLLGYPELWTALVRLAPDWPEGLTGLTSTAPCPEPLNQALLSSGLGRLLHVYGSTETAGVGWRDGRELHFELHPFWTRDPDDPARLLRTGPDGDTRPVSVQDQLVWCDERHFRPGPRIDGAVQVGGVNVHLGQVRERLLQHPELADVALRTEGVADGLRLKAFIVPAPGVAPEGLAQRLQNWARRQLAPAARPVRWTLGSALPRDATGKACDWD